MREIVLEENEEACFCECCGHIIAYVDEELEEAKTYGGEKVRGFYCPHCGHWTTVYWN